MKPITYFSGDALNPLEVKGRKIIVHVCNDLGVMGAGIALAIRKKWPSAYDDYVKWFKKDDFKLGNVQFVKVDKETVVANMIGQKSLGYTNGVPPIRYDAVGSCLKKVAVVAKKYEASVVGPKIGAGLAGGKWEEIEKLIIENLCEQDVSVYIYEL